MDVLRIRKLEPEMILELERGAERNGRSTEAEVCEIIRIALDEEDRKLGAAPSAGSRND